MISSLIMDNIINNVLNNSNYSIDAFKDLLISQFENYKSSVETIVDDTINAELSTSNSIFSQTMTSFISNKEG